MQDIVYAKPGVKPLKYDVYSPKGKQNLPCVVIIHGGGWRSNTEWVMKGFGTRISKQWQICGFQHDYRWIDKLDGDSTPYSIAPNYRRCVWSFVTHC